MFEYLVCLLVTIFSVVFVIKHFQKQTPTTPHKVRVTTDAEAQFVNKRIRIQQQTRKAILDKPKQIMDFQPGRKILPPGQKLSKRWTVLDLGLNPEFDLRTWKLSLHDKEKTIQLSLEELIAYGVRDYQVDFHCYTGWTVQDLKLSGIPFKRIVEHFIPNSGWKYLFQVGSDGYTCSSPRDVWEKDDIFLCYSNDGNPLSIEHGGIRLINTHLYGSKSAKYLTELYFLEELPEDPGL
eukprot:TRINITY_DN6456_c0_g1_i10.p1 TRINITY_DN6456_c0_g1~~TRINITY_DN6456_c0_g1_i10.p1  ORF type:complete len:237 (-),score=36.08 TRINITY_DN6456_c0_g1_i10:1381-2091(-)